ncbi:hypothetical protein [Xanthomonas arboricola]|uniref:hypothetical protein n=1 Tax=Xanthomonas arboricola TaxID=56448 RepID=UPI001618EF5E|nr:hypothetical protein [Xanthomonas arboricola]MBB4596500.1 hypothetical protein [Xanthomonas arboricola]
MVLESPTNEWQLIEQFLETLQGLPEVHANLGRWEPVGSPDEPRHDAQIELHVAGRSVTLLIEAKKAVYPRDVREVLWQLRDYGRSQPIGKSADEPLPLLVAESISPGAKDLLRTERVGYFDSGGSLFLPAHGAYLYIDRPPPKTLAKSVRSLFAGRRAQVLHALLVRHQDWFSVKDLAEQAQVSPATTSQVLTELERFDWLATRGQGPSKERHIKEPGAMLDAWLKQLASMRAPALRRYYVPALKADQLVEHAGHVFGSHQVGYAITHEAAAQRYAPFLSNVSQVRCRLLVGPAADAAINELGARAVNEGANLTVIEAKSPGELLFRERIGDVWLASPIQVYLDLLGGEGRAKEMAEHLRRDRIGF